VLMCHSVVTGERKHAGLIRKYGLNMSRQAFREKAAEIGFVKVCGDDREVVPVLSVGSTVDISLRTD
jgi:ribosomal protein S14